MSERTINKIKFFKKERTIISTGDRGACRGVDRRLGKASLIK